MDVPPLTNDDRFRIIEICAIAAFVGLCVIIAYGFVSPVPAKENQNQKTEPWSLACHFNTTADNVTGVGWVYLRPPQLAMSANYTAPTMIIGVIKTGLIINGTSAWSYSSFVDDKWHQGVVTDFGGIPGVPVFNLSSMWRVNVSTAESFLEKNNVSCEQVVAPQGVFELPVGASVEEEI